MNMKENTHDTSESIDAHTLQGIYGGAIRKIVKVGTGAASLGVGAGVGV